MSDVAGLLAKAAEKCGFVRERFAEQNIPTDASNVCVLPFFGDLRSMFVLSSLILHRFREQERGSKYFVVVSWPGFESLFPYVDEYWGVADTSIVRRFYGDAVGFRNRNGLYPVFHRSLNEYFFADVVPAADLEKYYKSGLTDDFWRKYVQVKRFLPGLSSSASLGKEFNRDLASRGGFKVFVHPGHYMTSWRSGDQQEVPARKEFWIALVRKLLAERLVPVLYKGLLTHDLAPEFTGSCLYCTETTAAGMLAAMRACGCVLDVFGGVSRLALAARCPFVAVDERAKHAAVKEYELDDLCGGSLPKQYIFSFPTIIESGGPDAWDFSIFGSVAARLNAFLPLLDRETWPGTGESTEVVPYDVVRRRKAKKLGVKFLKIPRC